MILRNVNAVLPGEIRPADIRIERGRIAGIADHLPANGEPVRDCNGATLMPGFIDTHTHGGLARAFFHEDADFDAIALAYARRGTTSLMPTFSVGPSDVVYGGIRRAVEFAGKSHDGAKFIGIHAEGPFLNPARHGGMMADYMRPADVSEYHRLFELCGGLLRIMTIAPELPGALTVIEAAATDGICLSAGHTDASYEEMLCAIDAGLSRMTHTFNAARPMNHREPGVLTAALTDPRVNCEVICDFGHLHPAAVKLIHRLKGCGGMTAVSDYSDRFGFAARGEGTHTADGRRYTVRNGVAWSESGQVLSNGNDLLTGVQNLRAVGVPLPEIAVMASENPARAAGCFDLTGSIAVGKAADLVLLNEKFAPIAVFVDGREITTGTEAER
ncbi:MAG: N-acetylglucosamine-6-phosphate deacetylase [Ruminococcaceae bacterium]|nr:N-acetylglucosamine-6-phosphate deacetylase [Oscillospiraceae bacterium]